MPKAENLPMTTRILRVKKGVYLIVIKFTQSKRIYWRDELKAASVKEVKERIKVEFPKMKFTTKD